MPTWFIGPGKTTRILQLRGGSEQKQQNKRFTLLGAQFGRISLTSRTTWQNICLLSSFLSFPRPSSFATLDLFSIMEDLVSFFSSFFKIPGGKCIVLREKSVFPVTITNVLIDVALWKRPCLMKEEGTTAPWVERFPIYLQRSHSETPGFKWRPKRYHCLITAVATRWQVQKSGGSLTGGQFLSGK